MKITSKISSIRTIKSGNPHFYIRDNFISSPRAGFEISGCCPDDYKLMLRDCITHGWIKPVAHVTERELLLMGLADK